MAVNAGQNSTVGTLKVSKLCCSKKKMTTVIWYMMKYCKTQEAALQRVRLLVQPIFVKVDRQQLSNFRQDFIQPDCTQVAWRSWPRKLGKIGKMVQYTWRSPGWRSRCIPIRQPSIGARFFSGTPFGGWAGWKFFSKVHRSTSWLQSAYKLQAWIEFAPETSRAISLKATEIVLPF